MIERIATEKRAPTSWLRWIFSFRESTILMPLLLIVVVVGLINPVFFSRPRRAGLVEILRRGVGRGELSADVNPELLADMIYGAKWNRLLFGHAPLDARMASQMVKLVSCLR